MENVLDLKMPGVQELGKKELKKVDGGFWWQLAVWFLGGVVWDTLNDPKSAKESFMEGFQAK